MVPKYETNKTGYNFSGPEDEIPFEQVYVASASDSAATINAKLEVVNYIIMQPGIYSLSEAIKVNKDRQVILGIGMPTL